MLTGAVILDTDVDTPGVQTFEENTVVAVIVVFVVAILVGTKEKYESFFSFSLMFHFS